MLQMDACDEYNSHFKHILATFWPNEGAAEMIRDQMPTAAPAELPVLQVLLGVSLALGELRSMQSDALLVLYLHVLPSAQKNRPRICCYPHPDPLLGSLGLLGPPKP